MLVRVLPGEVIMRAPNFGTVVRVRRLRLLGPAGIMC